MANQHNNLTTMSQTDFEKYCEAQSDEWKVKTLYKTLHNLAKSKKNCQAQNKQILELLAEKESNERELNIIRNRSDNLNILLKKAGYNPKKLLVYFKEEGCRDYACDYGDCIHDCSDCDYHYEQDRIGTFILYDFDFLIGTTYDDFDGWEHSVLNGINVNLEDVSLSGVTKIVNLETNKVIFERGEE